MICNMEIPYRDHRFYCDVTSLLLGLKYFKHARVSKEVSPDACITTPKPQQRHSGPDDVRRCSQKCVFSYRLMFFFSGETPSNLLDLLWLNDLTPMAYSLPSSSLLDERLFIHIEPSRESSGTWCSNIFLEALFSYNTSWFLLFHTCLRIWNLYTGNTV